MNWTNWFTKKNVIVLGGEKTEVKPIRLVNAIEFILLMAPYLIMIDDFKPQFEQALKLNDGKLLSALLQSLAREMSRSPGDIVKMVSLLTDKSVDWIALNVTGEEIVKAMPVLDKVNDFGKLLVVAQRLGVSNG